MCFSQRSRLTPSRPSAKSARAAHFSIEKQMLAKRGLSLKAPSLSRSEKVISRGVDPRGVHCSGARAAAGGLFLRGWNPARCVQVRIVTSIMPISVSPAKLAAHCKRPGDGDGHAEGRRDQAHSLRRRAPSRGKARHPNLHGTVKSKPKGKCPAGRDRAIMILRSATWSCQRPIQSQDDGCRRPEQKTRDELVARCNVTVQKPWRGARHRSAPKAIVIERGGHLHPVTCHSES